LNGGAFHQLKGTLMPHLIVFALGAAVGAAGSAAVRNRTLICKTLELADAGRHKLLDAWEIAASGASRLASLAGSKREESLPDSGTHARN